MRRDAKANGARRSPPGEDGVRMLASDRHLLARARHGDESAYQRLVEEPRGELHAHCYRMLGPVHDAEDALQDAFLRAWRGLPGFQGRSSPRSRLYEGGHNP